MKDTRQVFSITEASAISDEANISRGVFDGLAIQGADWTECSFKGCSLVGTKLVDVKLNAAKFVQCDLSNAILINSHCFSTTFRECKLVGVDFTQLNQFLGCSFEKCIFDYANLRDLDLAELDLSESSFIEADLSMADLTKTNLMNSNLQQTMLVKSKLHMTDMRGATLQGQTWEVLKGAILTPEQVKGLAEEQGITVMESE